jgi:hypothetical protein
MTTNAELKRLAEAVGPGTWVASSESVEFYDAPGIPILLTDPEGMYSSEWSHSLAALIAAANPARIIALVDEVERLRGSISHAMTLYEDQTLDAWEAFEAVAKVLRQALTTGEGE